MSRFDEKYWIDTHPNSKPHNHGICIKKCAAAAAAHASVIHGVKANRATTKLNFFSAPASRPNPAFNNITVKATSLYKKRESEKYTVSIFFNNILIN